MPRVSWTTEPGWPLRQTIGHRLITAGLFLSACFILVWSTAALTVAIGMWRMRPVCMEQRPVTAQEQQVIDAASWFLCTVEAYAAAAVPDQLCTHLRSGRIHFLTHTAAPSIGMAWFCEYGETTPLFQDKSAVSPQVTGYTIMLRRDLLVSVAQTIPVLAHELTHAVKSPVVLLLEPQRYAYETCLDENAVRDKAVIWGSHSIAWLS